MDLPLRCKVDLPNIMPPIDKVECLLGNKCEFYNCDECLRNKYTIQTSCKKCEKKVDEDRVYPYNQGCIKCCSEEQFALFVMRLECKRQRKLYKQGKLKLNVVEK